VENDEAANWGGPSQLARENQYQNKNNIGQYGGDQPKKNGFAHGAT
jgi:hypothetical protein